MEGRSDFAAVIVHSCSLPFLADGAAGPTTIFSEDSDDFSRAVAAPEACVDSGSSPLWLLHHPGQLGVAFVT